MTHIIGLMVFDDAGGSPAQDYAEAIRRALRDRSPSRDADIIPPGAATGNPVQILVRDAARNPNAYNGVAQQLFNAANADVVVVGDAIATRPTRGRRAGHAQGHRKAVLAGVTADPWYFGNAADNHFAGTLVTSPGLSFDRLRYLKTIAPDVTRVAIIRVADAPPPANVPDNVNHCANQEEAQLRTQAGHFGMTITRTLRFPPQRINPNFTTIPNPTTDVDAYIVIRDPVFQYNRDVLVARLNGSNVPVMYPYRSFVSLDPANPALGGLISHGPNLVANMYGIGQQVATILDALDADPNQTIDCSTLGFPGPFQIDTVINRAAFAALQAHGVHLVDIPGAIHV